MNEEEENDIDTLELMAKDGHAVFAMIQTNGWCNVVRPALISRKESLVREILNVSVLVDFIKIQQAINAIDGLIDFIEMKLTDGKSAIEELGNKQ